MSLMTIMIIMMKTMNFLFMMDCEGNQLIVLMTMMKMMTMMTMVKMMTMIKMMKMMTIMFMMTLMKSLWHSGERTRSSCYEDNSSKRDDPG